jgi:hypothetical protein
VRDRVGEGSERIPLFIGDASSLRAPIEVLIPILYLKGISFEEALVALFGTV